MEQVAEWFRQHTVFTFWVGIASLAMFVIGLTLIPVLVVRIPEDYFLHREAPPPAGPVSRVVRFLKNLLGVVLIILGVVMLALPGQGILTILAGLWLVDFPFKRRLELALVRRPAVLNALNWVRSKRGRPPLCVEVREDR